MYCVFSITGARILAASPSIFGIDLVTIITRLSTLCTGTPYLTTVTGAGIPYLLVYLVWGYHIS